MGLQIGRNYGALIATNVFSLAHPEVVFCGQVFRLKRIVPEWEKEEVYGVRT
jgi:hypothetical protein